MDLYPYSGTRSGAVTDEEHERLWSGVPDGVLPSQPAGVSTATALAVSSAGSTWTVQPGRFRIAGHVLDVDAVQSGAIPGAASATRTCVVTAYVDRTSSPWTYGARLVLGTPGGPRPAVSTSQTGLYEVALRAFTVGPTGAVTFFPDERPYAEGSHWLDYTPLWTGCGSATFGHREGRYRYVGYKHVKGYFYVTMATNGTGTTPVTSSLPTAPRRTIRQSYHGHAEDPGAILEAVTFASGSGTTIERILAINSSDTGNLTGADCPAGRLFTLEFDYEEAP